MTRLELALMRLSRALRGAGCLKLADYAIFGSTALILRGIIDREPGDIDVFVSRRAWGLLLADPEWVVETPNAGDPPILSHKGRRGCDDIHLNLFFAWRDDMVEINPLELIWGDAGEMVVSERYGGWRCATVAEVLRHKEAALSYGSAAVQKHRPDIRACRIHLGLDPVVLT